MLDDTRRPASEICGVLSHNLQILKGKTPVSEMCRQMGISRNQFNRYLSGESFPRPDVLERVCSYFGVSADILLHRIEDLPEPMERQLLRHAFEQGYLDLTGDFLLTLSIIRVFADTGLAARMLRVAELGHFSSGEMDALREAAGSEAP